jgi:hypothetical protein
MLRIETEEADGWNSYDCRICKREGYNKTHRACLYENPIIQVSVEGESLLPVDKDTAVVLCIDPPGGNILAGFQRWKDSLSRELCFVPCICRAAQELLSQEIDAEKYRWTSKPNNWFIQAFRTIRAERAGCENDRFRRLRGKHGSD